MNGLTFRRDKGKKIPIITGGTFSMAIWSHKNITSIKSKIWTNKIKNVLLFYIWRKCFQGIQVSCDLRLFLAAACVNKTPLNWSGIMDSYKTHLNTK